MSFIPSRTAGLDRLAAFLPRAGRTYAETRNHDEGSERANVSQLSPWLHAGLLRETEVIDRVLGHHSHRAAEKFIAEVFWRIYFKGYLEQRPTIWQAYCTERDEALGALDGNSGLRKAYDEAVEGRTGIAAFDLWARELAETGYLHNHARMWFASIWIFTLKLDWQLGADFFLRHLADGDAASNTLSWRWVGGLHTQGKTYLARPDNIARYTAHHPAGPLAAEGLAEDAPALEEGREHGRRQLDVPKAPSPEVFEQPYALILHDEAASHAPLDLPRPPALVIGAARPDARSPGRVGRIARTFALEAVRGGLEEAAAAFGCDSREWGLDDNLAEILGTAAIDRVVVPHLPVGWTRDALMPALAPLIDDQRATILVDDLDRATWPHARAGFFGVKKQIDGILGELGITGTRDPA
ncbi:FAD-binding domain-containing protein [Erythrobacter sp. JK5]|uniref:FAD-binding domain-containing protein n=1 Tax=Erythrobacter sp. JK5 TaxID=2829500 RepID=UPI001BAB84E4|nr:FAD-binding domain-containing protein [Erythrobacter sp. JK5]QUL37896.1 DNA photolyase [Erythrobacter sp. JK5]